MKDLVGNIYIESKNKRRIINSSITRKLHRVEKLKMRDIKGND